jgi:hypothetical protein
MKISVGISLTVIIVLILASTVVFLLFTGHFDGGKFEVIQTSWASSKLVVMVARRSDHEALSGDQYFVLVGDHPSAHELRYAYYHHGLIFRSDGACVTASWEDARNLVVSCHDGLLPPLHPVIHIAVAGRPQRFVVQTRRPGRLIQLFAELVDRPQDVRCRRNLQLRRLQELLVALVHQPRNLARPAASPAASAPASSRPERRQSPPRTRICGPERL